eukprot:COSAG01_NODE_4010_length_5437_cov_5.981828_10_plen_37_part_00
MLHGHAAAADRRGLGGGADSGLCGQSSEGRKLGRAA